VVTYKKWNSAPVTEHKTITQSRRDANAKTLVDKFLLAPLATELKLYFGPGKYFSGSPSQLVEVARQLGQ